MDPHDLILVIGVLVFGLLEVGVLLAEMKKTAWRRQKDRRSSEAFGREAEDGIHRA